MKPVALCCALAFAFAGCERAPAPAAGTPDSASRPAASTTPADTTPADTTPADSIPRLTPDGWGALRVGMTRAEVVAAAGEDANPAAVGGPEPEQCDQFRPARAPKGVLVMLVRGRLARISLSAGAPVASAAGIRVGDSAGAVLAAHGTAVERAPHKYLHPQGEYLTVRAPSAAGGEARGIRYEIDADGRVSHIHAGGPAIEYVEGCA